MNRKTRSLVWLVGILVLLGVVVFAWRLSPARTMQVNAPTQTIPTTIQEAPAFVEGVAGTSSESLVIPLVNESTTTKADLVLLVVGDIMLDRTVATRTKKSGDGAYPFRQLPAGWLAGYDLTVGNLEGPVTPTRRPPEKSIDFQFDPAWIPVLKEEGFDVLSQANNHALDQGVIGAADSLQRLRQAGFIAFGHQVDDGAIALATTTVKGERLAFLGWNNTDNPVNRTQAQGAIEQAKQEADLVIAYLHWGNEYRDRPDAQNVELAHWLIDQGVDVVIGGHPHWVQGVSSYKGRPIVWSLGNFIFDQDWSKETQQGLAVSLRISENQIGIRSFPLSIKLSQPALESEAALQSRLRALAKISDEALQEKITRGEELVFERSLK